MELKEQASYFAKSVAKDFNYASGVAGVVGGVVASFLGGWDVLIGVLTFFVVVDYVTGLLKAWHTAYSVRLEPQNRDSLYQVNRDFLYQLSRYSLYQFSSVMNLHKYKYGMNLK